MENPPRLRKAVAAGYSDVARFRYDADLAVLRDREDFQELLGQVETNALTAARDAVRVQPRNPESHNLLATLLRQQKKWPEAEAAYREALELRRKQSPPGHDDILWSLSGLTRSLVAYERGGEAVPLVDESVRLAETKRGYLLHQIPTLIIARLRHFQKVTDVAGCQATAEMWEKSNGTDNASFFSDAACCRAVTAAVLRSTDGSPETDKSGEKLWDAESGQPQTIRTFPHIVIPSARPCFD